MDVLGGFLKPPGHFQPVLAMKFLVESEFQGQGPPRTTKNTRVVLVVLVVLIPYIAL